LDLVFGVSSPLKYQERNLTPKPRSDPEAEQVTAVLMNLVTYLYSFSGKPRLAATRHYVCHPEKWLELLSIPIRE
jgi:hypothetical protein